jgi:phosphate transport system substrate-binding protein
MKNKYLYLFTLAAVITYSACSNVDKNGKPLSTTTSGDVKIAADETLLPVIDSQEQVFETIYPKADVNIQYLPESDIVNLFVNDSVQLIVLPRELNEEEMNVFKSNKIVPRTNKIATDAVALIINKANTDTTLELAQVREIIRGNITSWNQLDKNSTIGNIDIVFDNSKSSTVQYMIRLVGKKDIKGYALKTNEEVINYVGKNKGAIGIIGLNWISDRDDSSTIYFKKNINIIGIKGDPGDLGDDYFYQPYQAYLATKQYALIRSVYTICREPRAGLATGFASFINGDKGQKIILKAGLLPANAPIRIISTE